MRRLMLLLLLTSATLHAEPRANCLELKRATRFTMYFERVDLDKLVQTVSDATCRSFILGENVKGKISIVGPENGKLQLDSDQLYAAFLAALDANGFATVTQGRFTRIVEKPRAKQTGAPLVLEGQPFPVAGEIISRIYRLQHVEAETLRGVLTSFISQGGELHVVTPELLVITDTSTNQQRLAELVQQLDVARPSNEVTKLVPVRNAPVTDVLDKVSRALAPRPGARPSDALIAVADERTNQLLLSGTPATVERAERLVAQLDVFVPGDSRARVYRLKNADAKEVAATLDALTQSKAKAPNAPELRVSVAESLNALLIVSSAADYRTLAAVIEELDQPVRQVFIETLIMEASLQRDAQFGISAHGVGSSNGTTLVAGSEPAGGLSSLSLQSLAKGTGLLLGLQGPVLSQVGKLLGVDLSQYGITIQASQGSSDVNVLSMPHILTADNKEAEIVVGQRIPFQQGTNQTQLASMLAAGNTSGANLTSLVGSVTRERVELKLSVKPHIGDGEDIRLEINQQAEEVSGKNDLGPITSTRGQKATVIARNEETVVLGGIMQDREIDDVSKVPVLGDLPIIGGLFRRTGKTHTKVNLLVFLTPHIIRDGADYRRVVERKMQERVRALEEVNSERPEPELTIDFSRKAGPLAMMARTLAKEARKTENGGPGEPGERRVEPTVPGDG